MISKRGAAKLTTYQKARLQVVGYRAIQSEVSELLSQYELNTSQWIILGWLYDNPSGMRITAVAEILEVEVPLITALMQPLQRNKLIVLKTDVSDRRAKLATLTKAGVALVAKLEPAMAAQLAAFDSSIKSSEMDSYFSALQSFIYAHNRRSKH
jgi:DNA-binding MarR family transcriptional regulator